MCQTEKTESTLSSFTRARDKQVYGQHGCVPYSQKVPSRRDCVQEVRADPGCSPGGGPAAVILHSHVHGVAVKHRDRDVNVSRVAMEYRIIDALADDL